MNGFIYKFSILSFILVFINMNIVIVYLLNQRVGGIEPDIKAISRILLIIYPL